MVNTKTTPRKDPKCPMCPFRTSDRDEMKTHLVTCGIRKMNRSVKCTLCDYSTDKSSNLQRHMKKHKVAPIASTETEEQSESDESKDDWLRSDPGDLDDILGLNEGIDKPPERKDEDSKTCSSDDESIQQSEKEVDPTIRKPTMPKPVFTPKRKRPAREVANSFFVKDSQSNWKCAPPKVSLVNHSQFGSKLAKKQLHKIGENPSCPTPPKVPKGSDKHISVGTQTDIVKQRRATWKTTRWHEDDKEIEIIEMEELELE